MREKELRLAVVLTGGVSLAVFMHGVSREVLKLVRTSKVYHSTSDPAQRASYAALNTDSARETDTEEVYFDLLKAIAPHADLRIVLDVIAGASAGGVNGVMLARALAHDLPLDAHRAMWLEHADALDLMDEDALAKRWSKIYLDPIARALLNTWLQSHAPEAETRDKMRLFLRSRWFKPPFSGVRYAGWMLDACDAMAQGRGEASSLLPDGHPLDLFVSVTDFHGHNRTVRLHDPARIVEAEHRHHLHFRYARTGGGAVVSDFDHDHVPGIVFAARATSSFPGAFPPATIVEMDDTLARRGRDWGGRARFLDEKFRTLLRGGRDPEDAVFIDGSTVNNKPFAAAIGALAGRPAHREVMRRLIYVDPDPEPGAPSGIRGDNGNGVPGMLRTILAALVEIPGNEPVRDELERLEELNRRIRILRRVVELARPQIADLVHAIVGPQLDHAPDVDVIAEWRARANAQAAASSGFAFESYFRLKILTVLGRLERLLCDLAERAGVAVDGDVVRQRLRAWGEHRLAAVALDGASGVRDAEIEFLRAFDVDYRVRRLRFVIRRLNELYRLVADGAGTTTADDLDAVKTALYHQLDETKSRWDADFYGSEIAAVAGRTLKDGGDENELDRLLQAMAWDTDLVQADRAADHLFSASSEDYLGLRTRHELINAYIGFAHFDVLSFPMVQWEDLDELEEVLIHRISPEDARGMRACGEPVALKGASLRHFGAFFNRSYREHDYLWGRLTAADRLVDVVLDATRIPPDHLDLDVGELKQRLFAKILAAETPFLKADPDLIGNVKKSLARPL